MSPRIETNKSTQVIILENEETKLYVRKYEEGKSLFKYNAIDTEGGQSGSAIFTTFRDGTYGIVGVHTGGSGGGNWGVALNQERIDWIDKCITLDHSKEHECHPVPLKKYKNYRVRNVTIPCEQADDLKESGHIESIKDVWSDFRVMFKNIGWSQIPEELPADNDELCEIMLMIIEQNVKPNEIRNKQKFIDTIKLDNAFYNRHKQYIDDHLD